jgi:hypothetical protein
MPLFAHLVADSIALLRCIDGFCDYDLPAEIRHIEREKNGDVLHLKMRRLLLGACGDVRIVEILSAKVEIVNLFFFPNPAYALPVYALEFVVISQRPVVGVIDMPCLEQHPQLSASINTLMQQAHAACPVPQATDPPDWYSACRSPFDFFTRPRTIQELHCVHTIHTQLWTHLCTMLHTPHHALDAVAHQHALNAYKHHHRDNSPGIPLLKHSFGTAWTRRFLEEYLFV